ncbi:ArsR family transcriptional regulator [Micromonospora globispora]|uniref:ArsR family transcriptional regulator n=1 Tax=Micromonospora globispora TaxID=1450148 RepID=A0A317K6E9_9ACTN|nr:ArsR family transcriptional regulator [Micromonospora globispora]PWU48598.1 ArsR family transcriptional regulator [Micromonospora globispora]RQX01033.1 ArsR family transcriptional regulator [Micromonospora globispora]
MAASQAAPAFMRLAAHPLRWRLLSELADSDLRVRELVALIGQPQNLVSYHLRLLRNAGLITVTRSSFDGRDSYYHLDLDRCAQALASTGAALHPALRLDSAPPAPPVHQRRLPRPAVLFVCTGNSARSPIAEALLRHHTAGQVEATSAGSRPRPRLHPNGVRALRDQYGIDIASQRPRHLDTLAGGRFNYVITLCDKAREVCPEFDDHPRRVHWSIPDPALAGDSDDASYPAFARTAADIDTRVRHLLPVLTTRQGGLSHDRNRPARQRPLPG